MGIYYVAGIPYDSDYLQHHGIKGQKWGVRRWQDESGKWTPAGRERYGKGTRYEGAEDDHGRKGDNWEGAKFGARVAADIATFNVVGLAQDIHRGAKAAAGKAKSKKYEKEREKSSVDEKTGLKVKSKEMSEEDDLKRINPDVNNFNSNSKSNCMLCTTAYEMRRRGYDVTAEKASRGYKDDEIKSWFPKAKIESIPNDKEYKSGLDLMVKDKAYTNKVVNTLAQQPDGARGNIMVNWRKSMGAGHSMIYQVNNGKVTIMDGQVNKVYKNPNKILDSCYNVRFARLDNVDFDPKKIKECVG